jgi:hypothetical protein
VDSLDTQNLSLSDLPDLSEADELELTEPTDTQHFSLGSQQASWHSSVEGQRFQILASQSEAQSLC